MGRSSSSLHCNDDDLLVRTLARLAMGSSSLPSSIASVSLLLILFIELTCSTDNWALVELPVPNNKRLAQLSSNHRPVKNIVLSILLKHIKKYHETTHPCNSPREVLRYIINGF